MEWRIRDEKIWAVKERGIKERKNKSKEAEEGMLKKEEIEEGEWKIQIKE